MRALLAAIAAITGLHGTVTRGPTTPICRIGVPCSAPAAGAKLVFMRNGRVAARVRASARGVYAVRLAPGTYTVTVSPSPGVGGGIRPSSVHVASGVYARLDFAIDTGIR
jgi:hypothetical protein